MTKIKGQVNSPGGRQNTLGMSRRTFVKLSALAGALIASSRFLGRPTRASSDSSVDLPDGKGLVTEKFVPTSCLNCAARCATIVRVANGKAVKIIGNPLSQVTEGANCARVNVGLQVLYNPDRVATPLRRTNPAKGRGIDPRWSAITWDQALGEIADHMTSLRQAGRPHQLLLLHGLTTVSEEDVIHRLADTFGTPNVVSADALDNEADKSGEWLADGNYTQSAYDLARTNYILSFGANILESSKPLARSLRMWGKIRRERPNRAKVVVVDPRYSVTALRSDQWLPINPGTDAALALAIANVIIKENLYDASFIKDWTAGFEAFRDLVTREYDPARVAGITGISTETIYRVAREFAQTRPAIAWRGRGATSWPNGSYASYAIFCLNALVGSIDIPGGIIYQENPGYKPMPDVAQDEVAKAGKTNPVLDLRKTADFPLAEVATNQIADSILNGKPYPVEMAVGFNTNFNMTAPGTTRWDEALQKVPYYVQIVPYLSEMAQFADIILPSNTFMEEWGYDHSPPGSGFAEVRVKQPAVDALFDSRSGVDIVFELAKRVGGSVGQSFAGIGNDAQGFARFRTGNLIPWDEFIKQGVWVGPAYQYQKYNRIFKTPSNKFEFRSGNLENALKKLGQSVDQLALLPHYETPKFMGDSKDYPLVLSTYHPLLAMEDGGQNYPWAQEMFLVQHGAGWTNFAEMNRRTGESLGIKDGDMVWVESPFGKIKAKARVTEGVLPGVISIAAGQGHRANGRWANDIGVNPSEIIGVDYDRLSGQAAFFNTRVKVYRV